MASLGLTKGLKKIGTNHRRLTTTQCRSGLSEILAFIQIKEESIVLTQHRRDKGALVPINDFVLLEDLDEAIGIRKIADKCATQEEFLLALHEQLKTV